MTRRLIFLPISGREAAHIEVAEKITFGQIKTHIDGPLTMLAQGPGWEAYVDDEGMNKNLPFNEACAYLLHHLDKNRGAEHIWGPAVFLFKSDKSKAFLKASGWLERYKSETLSDDDGSEPEKDSSDPEGDE